MFRAGTREVLNRDGKPLVSVMINKLAVHERRNKFVVERIVSLHSTGRVLVVLSDRIAQLNILYRLVLEAGVPEEHVGMFTGSTKESDRAAQLERKIVMCSYGMANEGLDKREADTCIMATPKGRVVQCIGRIQRPCATKKVPLVVDIVDDDVPVFTQLRWKRQKMYSKEQYEVQVLSTDQQSDEWFA